LTNGTKLGFRSIILAKSLSPKSETGSLSEKIIDKEENIFFIINSLIALVVTLTLGFRASP
jgi:hypothetical protein